MIAKKYRFHGHSSLRWVFSKGKTYRSRRFLMRRSQNPKRKLPRLAVVVSKKVHKSAVVRNRIRRRVFEIVRREWSTLPMGSDIAITVYSVDVAEISHDEINRELTDLLRQLQ